ncbi:MAG: hypothetical protein FH753_14910 [Firmicutes bacterium]|nr:hypothetical protein [Bacillota bacterium]
MKKTKEIYILLTHTNTLFSNIIKVYTKARYNHVSISLNGEFSEVYSFGRKFYLNPFYAGFVKEDLDNGVYSYFQDTESVIYSLKITEKQYVNLYNCINDFKKDSNRYRYNLLGLIGVTLNRPINRKYHYFCSQFVSSILKKSGVSLFNKPIGLVTPGDFQECLELKPIYSGKLNSFKAPLAV